MRRTLGWRVVILAGLVGWAAAAALAADPASSSSATILQELRSFQTTGSVLYVAAHPDDENNRLLPYFALGLGYRTAYLSLTRGDGGQNLIGPELGEELGVIRTQELLAARRVDGASQYFSRARDFGFSKDSSDTLLRWDRQEVLSDVVRVIREFRPDVIVTRFSPIPGGTHGHHTASSILAIEGFSRCSRSGQISRAAPGAVAGQAHCLEQLQRLWPRPLGCGVCRTARRRRLRSLCRLLLWRDCGPGPLDAPQPGRRSRLLARAFR